MAAVGEAAETGNRAGHGRHRRTGRRVFDDADHRREHAGMIIVPDFGAFAAEHEYRAVAWRAERGGKLREVGRSAAYRIQVF